jgi:hypothetical protein
LQRWIDPAALGWYSGDHHVHAAGCSHYQDPTQGVTPQDMIRQVRGESLNIGSVLTWGPCYYHQKRYFSAQDASASTAESLIHYDVEVSGFPSSHAGHGRPARAQESGLPGHGQTRGLAHVDAARAAMGQAAGRRHRVRALRLRVADRGPTDSIARGPGV